MSKNRDLTDEEINAYAEQIVNMFSMTDVLRIAARLDYRAKWVIKYYEENEYWVTNLFRKAHAKLGLRKLEITYLSEVKNTL